MKVSLLNGRAQVKEGDRMVTFGSQSGRPFVPGVPIGKVVEVEATPGQLTKTVMVEPYVQFTRLDLVGVVVVPPRTDPRDAVLPPVGAAAAQAPAAPAAAAPPASPTGGTDPCVSPGSRSPPS